jgi:hypothetical protein
VVVLTGVLRTLGREVRPTAAGFGCPVRAGLAEVAAVEPQAPARTAAMTKAPGHVPR